jgi:hypothetical protein
MPHRQQPFRHMHADKTGCSRDESLHRKIAFPPLALAMRTSIASCALSSSAAA